MATAMGLHLTVSGKMTKQMKISQIPVFAFPRAMSGNARRDTSKMETATEM